jgi:tape measure domain-containing protein
MATNNRDVKMTLSVETLGDDEIKKLGSSIAALAKEGGDAAPEFERLAEEVNKLGEQAQTLAAFQALSEATSELASKQDAASIKADELRTKLEAAKEATAAAAESQRTAAAKYAEAQKGLADIAGELATLRASYDAAGKKTDEYKQAVTGLITKKTELQKASVDLRNERDAANKTLTQSVSEENKAQSQYDRSTKSLETLTKQIQASQVEQNNAAQNLAEYGLEAGNVAAAQAQLVTSLNQLGESARNVRAGLDAAAEAERELTAQAEAAAQRILERTRYNQQAYEIEQQLAAQRIADEQRVAAAAKAASDTAIAARKAEQQESDRLYEIQRKSREKMELDAKQALVAEVAAQREAAALTIQLEKQKQAAIEASAKAQADAISNAFRTIGARGANELRQEIEQVKGAMNTLSSQAGLTGKELQAAMAAGNTKIKELERDLRAVTGEMTLADRAAKLFSNSMGQITAGNLLADGIASIIEKVKEMGRQFVAVNVQADSMRRALNAIYKDSATTAQQIDFLRQTATSAGVSIANVANDFVKFSAATQASGIPLQQTNELFASLTTAASSLGLGADKTSLALNALGQMASKGVVSMEELRQQLGDAIPGALTLTAKGFGITDAELVKLVESGQLAARDFFPAFTKGLQTMQGETDGLRQSWERFKNVLTIAATNAGDAGWVQILTMALKGLGLVVGTITLGLSQMYEGLMTLTRGAIVFFETMRGNGAQALGYFNEEVAKSVKRLDEQNLAIRYMLNPTEELRQKMLDAGVAVQQLGSGATTSGQALRINAEELRANAEAAKNVNAGQTAAAQALRITGDASSDAGAKWVQLNTEMLKLRDTQEQAVAVSEKARTAAEREAEAVTRLGALRGDSTSKLESERQAASLMESALQKVASARESETAVLTVQLNEMVRLAMAQDGSLDKRKLEIEAIQKKLDAAREEAAAARNAADGARVDREQRELAIQTYKDNSDAVDQLRRAMELANRAAELTAESQRQGIATTKQVAEANIEAARTTALYRDALRDTTEKIQANNAAKQADYQIALAGMETRAAQIRSLEATAKAIGDENLLTYAKIEAKNLEISVLKATTAMQIAEAQGTIEVSKAKLEELKATDPLNKVKQIELETSIKIAEAKIIEAKARGQGVDILLREIQALREGTAAKGENAASANKSSQSISSEASSREKNATAIDKETDALKRRNSVDKDGFSTNSSGERVSMAAPNLELLQFKQRAGTLTSADASLAKAAYEEELQKYEMYSAFAAGVGGGSVSGLSRGRADAAKAIYDKLIAEQKAAEARTQTQNAYGSATTAKKATSTTPKTLANDSSMTDTGVLLSDYASQLTSATARGDKGDVADLAADIKELIDKVSNKSGATYNITLNGQKYSIGVANKDSENALMGLLQQLESSSSRSY